MPCLGNSVQNEIVIGNGFGILPFSAFQDGAEQGVQTALACARSGLTHLPTNQLQAANFWRSGQPIRESVKSP